MIFSVSMKQQHRCSIAGSLVIKRYTVYVRNHGTHPFSLASGTLAWPRSEVECTTVIYHLNVGDGFSFIHHYIDMKLNAL